MLVSSTALSHPLSLLLFLMSFVSWYSGQFGTWNRTRRLRQTPYLARTDTNTSRVATAMAQQGEDPPMNQILPSAGGVTNDANTATNTNTAMASTTTSSAKKTSQEPLFGPNIGFISSGPSWAITNEKKVITDDLTPDVVKAWIEKGKQPSYPTTTLQALVNLKRPTLRLSPLSIDDPLSPSGTEDEQQSQQHGLEFEFDCDAPKCGIYVHILLPKEHPDAASTVSPSGYSRLLVFETVTEGGFGNFLKVEDGAVLELGRFEQGRKRRPAVGAQSQALALNTQSSPPSGNISKNGDQPVDSSSNEITEVSSPPLLPSSPEIEESGRPRRKFAPFHFRKRMSQGRSVTGPALAVVDMGQAQQAASGNEGEQEGGVAGEQGQTGAGDPLFGAVNNRPSERRGKKDGDEGKGVKVMIRLAALDEMGTELMSPNEQVTYLHIVRFGMKDPAVEEDTRPWVVKVVKREATIGPHTFHLHEIYGLTSSASSQPSAPTAPLPSQEHSYPPSAPLPEAPILTPPIAPGGANEELQSECLLCLSEPREVVLLPCRHLVACRECALNMVEFGAGGQITQPTDDSGTATATAGTTGGEGGEGAAAAGAGTPTVIVTTTNRRRRKAKGWYCPVCRQPYTSLLRITTHSPSGEKDGHGHEHGDEHDHVHSDEVANGVQGMEVLHGEEGDITSGQESSGRGRRGIFRMANRRADENV